MAALLVKVMARILKGDTPISNKCAILHVNTLVLPLPAPAKISMGPSVAFTAAACSGFKPCIVSVMGKPPVYFRLTYLLSPNYLFYHIRRTW